jgi:hypothetical protein
MAESNEDPSDRTFGLNSFTPEELKKLRHILDMEPELTQVVKSKMITQGVVNFVGEVAKYVTGLIALIIAYRQLYK